MKRIQEFEFETTCKNLETALKRFQKKYPKCFEIWGEQLEYMARNGQEVDKAITECGYCLNVNVDYGFGGYFFYFDVQIYDEGQRIDEKPTYTAEQLAKLLAA